jgi:hypothetical protein
VRAPENKHQPLVGVCGDVEQSTRRSGERTPRRLDRHSRRAQGAKWCRLSEQCRLGIRRVGLQNDHFRCSARRIADERRRTDSERRRGGSGRRSDSGEPGAVAFASATAAAALLLWGEHVVLGLEQPLQAVREKRSAPSTPPRVADESVRAEVSGSPGSHCPSARTRPPPLSTPPHCVL